MVEDINEQKQALEELHRSQARFQAIFKDSAVGMGIMGLDRRIIDANFAICRMYGITREEMIGMSAAEVTYPQDNLQSTQLLNELVSGQRNSYEIDRRYIRRNGECLLGACDHVVGARADGTPLYLVGMVIDIDEQEHAAERIRVDRSARFQAVFDNVAVGVAVMTLDRQTGLAINAPDRADHRATAIERIGRASNPAHACHPRRPERGRPIWFEDLVEGRRDSWRDGTALPPQGRTRLLGAHQLLPRCAIWTANPTTWSAFSRTSTTRNARPSGSPDQEADYLLTLQQRVRGTYPANWQKSQINACTGRSSSALKIEEELAQESRRRGGDRRPHPPRTGPARCRHPNPVLRQPDSRSPARPVGNGRGRGETVHRGTAPTHPRRAGRNAHAPARTAPCRADPDPPERSHQAIVRSLHRPLAPAPLP
ncbi:MAG: PAS domain S-box protein [Sphingobacterium sp.]|nr:PAS domain S-box protein [Sphingobacterium sp.]